MSAKFGRKTFIQGAGFTLFGAALTAREVLAEPTAGFTDPEQKTTRKGSTKGTAFKVSVQPVSGIPLGGIGAGSIEIRPDGYFDDWLIFNMGSWSPEQPEAEQGPTPNVGPEGLQFFLRTEKGENIQLRRLGVREDQNDLYSLAYALPVEGIEFDGKFPFATLKYLDDSIPVQVSALAFAPIIPQDSRSSATPGFTVAFKVKNVSNAPVKASLMGALRNPLAVGAEDRALRNERTHAAETTTIALSTSATTGRKSCHGSMALSVSGGTYTAITGTFGRYLSNGWWGGTRGYGSAHFSYLAAYRRDGKLPNLDIQEVVGSKLKSLSESDIANLSTQDLQAIVADLRKDAFFNEFIARIELIDPAQLESQKTLVNLAIECKNQLNSMNQGWGDTALESTIDLAPGEEKEIRFVLSWFFPNHFSQLGPNLGHQYEHWFKDAAEVNAFLVTNHSAHRKATIDFAETLLNTNLEPEVAFAWSAQLTTLIKSSWWCKDGRFAIWEGLGCCGLHTTDITYQGSFPIIALFPDLQKQQIKMGASYQRKDGRIPHFFAPDLLHVDNGFDRVDMNPQYVMMVCRDYLWTGDKEFVKNSWTHVVQAMASTERLDSSGEGIPDSDTRRNTYDQWDLEGSPAYICSLWLGALRSAIRLATDIGETALATKWTGLLEKASARFQSKLWNGEYFDLWATDKDKDECCMSDQLSGEWYTGQMGLGHSVPREKILGALAAVHKYNYSPEFGLINASYPKGRKPRFRTHQNLQAAGNWTGIEYANAALMIEMGMIEEGLAVLRSVHDRYVRSGRRWNHVECGDHYFRAMSSWTTMLALTGFRVDIPGGKVSFDPKIDGLAAPWFASTGYGLIQSKKNSIELDCRNGTLSFAAIGLRASAKSARVTLNGALIEGRMEHGKDESIFRATQAIELKPGSKLKISLS